MQSLEKWVNFTESTLFPTHCELNFGCSSGPGCRDPAGDLESQLVPELRQGGAETGDKEPLSTRPMKKKGGGGVPSLVSLSLPLSFSHSLPQHMGGGGLEVLGEAWMMYGAELPTGTWALNRRKAENERREEGEGGNEKKWEGVGDGWMEGGRQTGGCNGEGVVGGGSHAWVMPMQSRNWPSETAEPPNRNRFTTNNKAIIRQLTAKGETGAPPLRGRDKPGRLGATGRANELLNPT